MTTPEAIVAAVASVCGAALLGWVFWLAAKTEPVERPTIKTPDPAIWKCERRT